MKELYVTEVKLVEVISMEESEITRKPALEKTFPENVEFTILTVLLRAACKNTILAFLD